MLKETMLTALKNRERKNGDRSGAERRSSESDYVVFFMASGFTSSFLGLYGACSTMTESLLLGSMLTDGGFAHNIIVGASSHFCTAERQFRMPVEHGNQRPPSAQWTATASGAMVVSEKPSDFSQVGVTAKTGEAVSGGKRLFPQKNIAVDCGTIGKVIDAGVKDANQMGVAMAPAAVDTILNHFEDTGRTPSYYDLILTGDLGYIGKDIAPDLLKDAGLAAEDVDRRYDDCGTMLYYRKEQDVHGGGSGCGCSACVFSGNIIQRMQRGELSKVLLISTGAMLSTVSPFQGREYSGDCPCSVIINMLNSINTESSVRQEV